VSTGFGQREEAIFQIDEVQFQISSQIINMVVSNNILVVLLDTFQLLTIDLDNPIQVKGNKKKKNFNNTIFLFILLLNRNPDYTKTD
jgi:hypothetical protein